MTTIFSRATRALLLGAIAISLCIVPQSALAASEDLACILIVSTPRGNDIYSGEREIEIRAGERVIIGWIGQNADTGTDRDGKDISMVGLQVLTATDSGTYAYEFGNDEGKATCTASLRLSGSTVTAIPTPFVPAVGGTLSVSMVPLLAGGTIRAETSIPVAYVQVSNPGATTASLNGFSLAQRGSASTDTVIGFSTSDNAGGSRTTIGGTEGSIEFTDGTAFVPLQATIAAGQFKIFTLKAILGSQSARAAGRTLALDVTSVDTTATLRGSFPLRGTVWTFGN